MAKEQPVRILVVDDHKMIHVCLRQYFGNNAKYQIVGEVESAEQALTMLQETAVDVVLSDIMMEGMGGIEFAHTLSKEYPEVKLIVLSMLQDPLHVRQVLYYGALGYLLKTATAQEMLMAVDRVMKGERYYSQEVVNVVMESLSHPMGKGSHTMIEPLTNREKEVLEKVVQDYTNGEIADALCISIRTVETHKHNLMDKLNVKTLAGLTTRAIILGLVDSPCHTFLAHL